jgi:hypothetical protein
MRKFLFGLTILAALTAQPGMAYAASDAKAPATTTTAAPPPAPLTTFFTNIGRKYPNGVYYCCAGIPVTGPNNNENAPEQWYAVAYTPSATFTLKRIQLAVGYFSGTNNIIVAVFGDNGTGLPNVQLGEWHVRNMPPNGSCCLTETSVIGAGLALAAGVKYWIALKTINTDKDALVFWERNTTDQVNSVAAASFCSQDHQGSCTVNDHWISAGATKPAPAFALLGN